MLTRDEAFDLAQQQSTSLEDVLISIENQARAGQYSINLPVLSQVVMEKLRQLGFLAFIKRHGYNYSSTIVTWGK